MLKILLFQYHVFALIQDQVSIIIYSLVINHNLGSIYESIPLPESITLTMTSSMPLEHSFLRQYLLYIFYK
jgi:hypothetical protein